MDKQHILDEIQRTAEENGGQPLGRRRFEIATGIRMSEWYGKHWGRWGDAVREAGYTPQAKAVAYPDDFVIGKLVDLIQELGRFPVSADLRMRARADSDFPSQSVFDRVGSKAQRAAMAIDYCRDRGGLDDVIALCEPEATRAPRGKQASESDEESDFGFVYMFRSGRYYKIGRTNSVGRRGYELAIQLPEPATLVHEIKTDDPAGIEKYWHQRFADKHKNGEWFELSGADVKAFKRRKFM